MHGTDVDLDKLAIEVKKRLIDEGPGSWWAEILYKTPQIFSLKDAFRIICDRYDGAPDAGPMPSGHMVTLAYWVVTGISPNDFQWLLKTYPWIGELRISDLPKEEPKLGKVRLTFKTPDVTDQIESDFSEEQWQVISEKLKKWIDYGELMTVEFDLDRETAVVVVE